MLFLSISGLAATFHGFQDELEVYEIFIDLNWVS